MRPLVPAHVETLSPYVPGKPIEETQREYGLTDVIKLASNENPLGPSPKALESLARVLGQLHLYPDSVSTRLRQRLAEHLSVTPDEVVLGSGSNEIIELLVRAFMDVGDEALLSRGTFLMYKVALHAHGRRHVEVPMKDGHADLEALAARVGPHTRILFLANPDNPLGTWFTRRPFERFIDRVHRANPNTLVVVDEAYFEYVTDPEYPDSMRYRSDYPNLATVRTFSKIYGLAGLRLGYAVVQPELAAYLNRVRMPFNVTVAAQAAGLGALDDVEHVRRTRELNAEGLRYLREELARLGVSALPSQANFLLVDLKRPAAPVYEALLRKGVITRLVANYGFPNSLRISTGTREHNERAMGALREVLQAS